MGHPAKVCGAVDKGTSLHIADTFPFNAAKAAFPRMVLHGGFAAVQDDISRSAVSFAVPRLRAATGFARLTAAGRKSRDESGGSVGAAGRPAKAAGAVEVEAGQERAHSGRR